MLSREQRRCSSPTPVQAWSPEARTRAFDRFWSVREDNAGTGLGLAIVRHLGRQRRQRGVGESVSGGIEAVATFRQAPGGDRRVS